MNRKTEHKILEVFMWVKERFPNLKSSLQTLRQPANLVRKTTKIDRMRVNLDGKTKYFAIPK
jgi:hypothetical protein